MMARLAAYYLCARPYRYGLLEREVELSYVTGAERKIDVRAIVGNNPDWETRNALFRQALRERVAAKLAAVDGDAELLRGRRVDAIWIDISDHASPVIEAHEIKTTWRDAQVELRRPAKSAPALQRAHRFWLTIPSLSVVAGLDVPESWGILVLPYGAPPVVERLASLREPTVEYPPRGALRWVRRRILSEWRPRAMPGRNRPVDVAAARVPWHVLAGTQ